MNESIDVTVLLEQVDSGSRDASDRLFAIVYDELRALAASQMRRETSDDTLQSTALVHEAWLKLIGNRDRTDWKNRGHCFAAASQAMRRILVDAARTRQRQKRGGANEQHELRDDDLLTQTDDDLLALNEALEQLEQQDGVKAELVNLRYFGGFTNKQAAEHLGISTATAERHWTFARAWLRAQLENSD